MQIAAFIINTTKSDLREVIDRHYIEGLSYFCLSGNNKPTVPDYCIRVNLQRPVNSVRDHDKLLKTEGFWDMWLDFDRVLVFQPDSGLLRNDIETFTKYDYVGAPWKFQNHGGNGGLSLRNPSVMAHICRNYSATTLPNEDVWFSNIMHTYGIGNLAPREVCADFSVEAIYRLGTFGYHDIESWLTEEQVETIKFQTNADTN